MAHVGVCWFVVGVDVVLHGKFYFEQMMHKAKDLPSSAVPPPPYLSNSDALRGPPFQGISLQKVK